MTNPVINHRDPVELFNRLMVPIVEQIHIANLAMVGWLTHELGILPNEFAMRGVGNLHQKIDFLARRAYGRGIGTSATTGGVGNDNGTGNIFSPSIEFEARPVDDAVVSDQEWCALQTWLQERYPTGDVTLYGSYIAVCFSHNNGVTTF